MNTTLLTRRFLVAYARNPINLVLLVVVPVVLVIVSAGALRDFARLLGGAGAPAVQAATAGWAAGFLAALAMYFQARASRDTDRRLVLAGLPATRLVAARLATGLGLAALVSAGALTALAVRTGIHEPARVVTGTLLTAVIYLAIGAVIGALVRDPVNGAVLILFVWFLDVFFGPGFGSPGRLVTRVLPTHYLTLWTIDLPSGHAGRPGDLGWALVWAGAALVTAAAVVTVATRAGRHTYRTTHRTTAGSTAGSQLLAGLRAGARDYRRNPLLWVLLLVVPVVFVLAAKAITPNTPVVVDLPTPMTFWLPRVHVAVMAPIAVAALAALAGLFVVLNARAGDRRLTLAGFRTGPLLAARLTVIAVAVLLVTGATLAVTATVFDATQWLVFATGNLLLAATYGLVGVCLGPLLGRVGGVFTAFLVPFLDVGIAQDPMLRAAPAAWAHWLPGYGAVRVLLDGGLTADFDETRSLLLALGWLLGLGVAATFLFHHYAGAPRRARQLGGAG
ncbi:MAG: ABC transporter permease [Actinomycetota bacterium]